jgi:cell division protein FtsI (penicillin-binding protein 3)
LLVLGRAFYIQRFEGQHWRSMSDSLHQRFIALDAERGTIYSEDGEMLSTSIPTFDIYIDFNADGLREKKGKRFKENVDSFAFTMSNYFADKTTAQYKKELFLAFKRKRYYSLKKKLSFEDTRHSVLSLVSRRNKGYHSCKYKAPTIQIANNRTIGLSRNILQPMERRNKMLGKEVMTVLNT